MLLLLLFRPSVTNSSEKQEPSDQSDDGHFSITVKISFNFYVIELLALQGRNSTEAIIDGSESKLSKEGSDKMELTGGFLKITEARQNGM